VSNHLDKNVVVVFLSKIHFQLSSTKSKNIDWHSSCNTKLRTQQVLPINYHFKLITGGFMKRIINATLTLAVVLALGLMFTETASAQTKGTGTPKGQGQYFVDQDGDGICDNVGTHQGQKMGNGMKGKGMGPKDGTGNKGQGPKDGTGFGSANCTGTGTGVCDGTGPKGNMNRGGKK
jgi:hypothetical protein